MPCHAMPCHAMPCHAMISIPKVDTNHKQPSLNQTQTTHRQQWVRTQRRYYKLWRRRESVPLTKERMELVDHLGFVSWLPAEENVSSGGFRGGRPKKWKREDDDVLAAVNSAAGGHSVPGFYHQLTLLAAEAS